MEKQRNSVICFINGVLSLILGGLPMMYQAITPVSGQKKGSDAMYNNVVSKMDASVDRMKLLVVAGIILLITALAFKLTKHNETKQTQKLLLFIPLAIILLYSLVNYIPLFTFQIMYN